MALVALAVALFGAYVTGNRLAHPFIDGDLFWQRRLGTYVLAHHALPAALGSDTFTAAGAPWVPQEWLLGTIVAFAFAHRVVWALSLLAGAALVATLLLTALRAKRAGAGPYATLAALLFAGICMEAPFAIRAQVLAWPLLAALLLALDCDDLRALWAIPIVAAWANVHASATIAVPIVWLDALVSVRRLRGNARALRIRAALAVFVPLALLATPLGIELPLYAAALMHSPIRQYIAEWQPLAGLNTQVVAGLLPLAAVVLYGAPRLWRSRPRDVALTIGMAILALLSVRNVALFAIVAVVPASLTVSGGEAWSALPASRRVTATAILAAILLVPATLWIGFRAHPMIAPWQPPRRSIEALARIAGDHRLLCAEYSWCALALGVPNVRVFLDGRADPYPVAVWQAFATVSALQPGWKDVLRRYGVNAIVVADGDPLESALRSTAGWRLMPQVDSCCSLFVRP